MKTLWAIFWVGMCCAMQGCLFVPFKTVYKNVPDPMAKSAVQVVKVEGTQFTLADGRQYRLAGVSVKGLSEANREAFEAALAKETKPGRVILLGDMGDGTATLVSADVHFFDPSFRPGWGIPIFPIIKPRYPMRIDLGGVLIRAGLANVKAEEEGGAETLEGALGENGLARQYAAAEQEARVHHRGLFETDAERLIKAVLARDVATVRTMLERGVDPNVPAKQEAMPPLALLAAANMQDKEMLELLLDHGADVNKRAQWGAGDSIALAVALQTGNMEISRMLVEHGASYLDDQGQAWPWVNGYASAPVVNYMLELKAPLPQGEGAARLVTNLARDNQLEVLGRLLDAGIECNGRLGQGATPLMMTARFGTLSGVKLLVEHGANVRAKAENGETAVDWARKKEIHAYLTEVAGRTP